MKEQENEKKKDANEKKQDVEMKEKEEVKVHQAQPVEEKKEEKKVCCRRFCFSLYWIRVLRWFCFHIEASVGERRRMEGIVFYIFLTARLTCLPVCISSRSTPFSADPLA